MTKKPITPNQSLIYQAKDGAIELRLDKKNETILANLNQIADLFAVQKAAISKHLNNIFKEGELEEKVVVSILETTTSHGAIVGKTQVHKVKFYNLDAIIAVGYRVNSGHATNFRIWATKVLKNYLLDGVAVNKKLISQNYQKFSQALKDIKLLLPKDNSIAAENILDLVTDFAATWLSLDAYDKDQLETKGTTTKKIKLDAKELELGVASLKAALIKKNEATEIFAKERQPRSLEGIIGNVMQSFGGQDLYQTLEEKAAHLLYFIVKNHPFIDGNKRSGAFAFVWFLQKNNLLDQTKISPQALTAITLLVAESNPKEKDKIVGLILTLLKQEKPEKFTNQKTRKHDH